MNVISLSLVVQVPLWLYISFVVFDERKNMESEKKRQMKEEKEKELNKPQGPAVTAESLGVGVDDGESYGGTAKRTGNKVDKASDDFIFEKFKNRTRDSWRYR